MPLKIGTSAPDFTLKTKTAQGLLKTSNSARTSASGTPCCFSFPSPSPASAPRKCATSRAAFRPTRRLNAAVYGISVDSPFAQEAWAQKEKITLKLLSDLNKTVTKAYDVVFPNLAGVGDTAARAAIVIDKQGKIVHANRPRPRRTCRTLRR
jgi:peroxiredoxin